MTSNSKVSYIFNFAGKHLSYQAFIFKFIFLELRTRFILSWVTWKASDRSNERQCLWPVSLQIWLLRQISGSLRPWWCPHLLKCLAQPWTLTDIMFRDKTNSSHRAVSKEDVSLTRAMIAKFKIERPISTTRRRQKIRSQITRSSKRRSKHQDKMAITKMKSRTTPFPPRKMIKTNLRKTSEVKKKSSSE